MTEGKLDLFAEHKAEYAAKTTPSILEIGPATYLCVEGVGSPDGELFADSIGALYGMAFTLKMRRKFAGLGDYAVGRMECFYPQKELPAERREWRWRLAMRSPDFLNEAELVEAASLQKDKGKSPLVDKVRLSHLTEGLCAQALHVGPYDECRRSFAAMQSLAEQKGFVFEGEHHEIYLNDPRRTPSEKLKTILRHPLRPK